MNIRIVAAAACMLTALTGCSRSDKTAQDYAKKLNEVVNAYSDQVDAKIAAEQKFYAKLAELDLAARDQDVMLTLRSERRERSEKLADELLTRGRPITDSELKERIREYGTLDFNSTREILEKEVDQRSTLTRDLAKLTADSQKIEDLTKALDELAKPKSRAQQLKELVAFAKAVDEEFNRLTCADLKKQLAELKKALAATPDDKPARKKSLQLQIDSVETRIKNLKCPDM